ncbi:DUF4347 domain-containing protein [Microcoleus sp. bin48.metabat.b7b8b9.023]|uniref:DUF4347 domain-containing protein n=2 Tax=unclassified Microcoleus TaxID=2642155 RepID=UPI0025F131FD|nr:DUF4347 domain-containing protein [Microcoleus sp. bin48.metabat.b7b8b9.023]
MLRKKHRSPSMKNQIIFVDPSVQDYQDLIQSTDRAEIIILDDKVSGITQITNALANQKDIEALHILSHGSPGSVNLSTETINNSNLEKFTTQLQQWGKSLTQNADILLYGCEIGADETGKNFLKRLSEITGADIAASANPTGSSELGGDWELEVQIGAIETAIPFSLNTLKTYSGVLGLAPKFDFAVGNLPLSVSIGDINGDGKPDLATANYISNTASILLNTTPTNATTPTFATKVDFTTGSNPISVSIRDFNGDNKPDLALANRNSDTASILLNTTPTNATTPTFATKVDFTTGNGPYSVSIGDFNSDGKPDLALANRSSNNVSILLNTTPTNATTPTFATKVDFTAGNGPLSVSIGDINGDGKPDLAVVNFISNNLSILLNTTPTNATTPTFATQVIFGAGNEPRSISIGDINGDGKPDLAVANVNNYTASILLNTTPTNATTPTFASRVTFSTGNDPISVSIGDINGDGLPDLAVANILSNTTSILLNTTPTNATTPTFASRVTFITGNDPISVSIGDINGDGLPDLAVANSNSNTASILLNTTPKVTAVTATTPDGSYGVGSTIPITVTFDAAVNITGTPRLQLETGTTDQFATYASGSGGTALTFNYVVQPGDTSLDLQYLSTTALTLNGGTIQDNLTTNADLILPALATANSLGGSKAIVIDTVAPTITSVTSTTANGSYNTTNNINVTVNFSEAVTLAGGNMTVALDTGGTVTIAPFTGTSAVGIYTPLAGQNSTDLNSTGFTLAVGATFRDTAANNATLTIPAGQSLANNKAIVVDTIVPNVTLTSTSPTTTNAPFLVTATFSETVTGFTAAGVNLTNSTISNFTGSGTTYTFTVTPNATGNVTVDIPAARATDTASNNNTAATQLTRTADITAPTVALTSASPTTTNAPFLVTATFSENVTGFTATGVNLTNSTISNFTGSGTTYQGERI